MQMRKWRGLFGRRQQQSQNNNQSDQEKEQHHDTDTHKQKPKRKNCGCGCAELKLRSKELLWFDGENTFVDCGLFKEDVSQAISVEACIKRTAVDPLHIKDYQVNGHIVNQGGGWDEPGWSLFIFGGQLRVELQQQTKTILGIIFIIASHLSDNSPPDRDEWAHVVFTWNAKDGVISTYVNGAHCTNSKHHGHPLPKPDATKQHVNIGRNEKREIHFCGFIADVRVWNRELSPEEIEKNSKCFKYEEGSHEGLVAYYPLDEGTGTVAHCKNNPSYDGTITSPLWVRNGMEPRPNIQYEEIQIPPSPVTREWAGRKCTWKNVSINGKGNHIQCFPGEELTITLSFEAKWSYNNSDYCPGCVVQLYYGMMDTFSQGVVEHGIHNHVGTSTATFYAPNCAGIYYVTQHISLDYHFVSMNPPNDPNSSIAVVQVIPLDWTPSKHKLFPPEIQTAVKTVLMLALKNPSTEQPRHPECSLYKVPKDVLFIIFQYLVL